MILSCGDARLRLVRGGFTAAQACSFYGIAHEHGYGHGADATGNGSKGASNIYRIGMHVADERGISDAEFFEAFGRVAEKALGFGGISDPIGAYVNYGGARPYPVRRNVTGLAHGRDEDVGAAHRSGQVTCFGMADRYGGVGMHQQQGHGLAHNVAASENHCVRAFHGDITAAENFHAARGSARHEPGAATNQAAEIHGMKSVDVFGGIDGFE